MASKYGQQLYGADLYSSSVAELAGGIVIASTLAGRLTESEPLQGAIVLSVAQGGRLTESEPVAGGISFMPALGGYLLQTSRYRGNIDVFPVITGAFTRVGSRDYDGNITISVVPRGLLSVIWKIKSNPIVITMVVSGGSDVYIGDFWKPDVPISGPWAPIVPVSEIWEPIPRSG
jgi:hypothetical protein